MSDTPPIPSSCRPRGPGRVENTPGGREIASSVHFLAGFGNTTIILGSSGVAVIDPGLFANGPRSSRSYAASPISRSVRDLPPWPLRPRIRHTVAPRGRRSSRSRCPGHRGHVNVAKRFERYAKALDTWPGRRAQFAIWTHGGDVVRDAVYCPPTIAYEERLVLDGLGDQALHFVMASRDGQPRVGVDSRSRVVVGGTSSCRPCRTPGHRSVSNATCSNGPRPSRRWLPSTRQRSSPGAAEFPVHGQEMLATTARALRYLDGEVVRRLNEGQWQEQILAEVELPDHLHLEFLLQPLYGWTAFAVRDIIRHYMGWYDGNPSMLFRALGRHRPRGGGAAGGTGLMLDRARSLHARMPPMTCSVPCIWWTPSSPR